MPFLRNELVKWVSLENYRKDLRTHEAGSLESCFLSTLFGVLHVENWQSHSNFQKY